MRETQNIEWKENWRDEYLKWICGFANAEGGKLFIGINDIEFTGNIFNEAKAIEENKFDKTSDKTSDKIIQLIKDNSKITINELVRIIGISQRAIEMQLSSLQKDNRLKRVGGRKHGYWEIRN